MAVQIRDQSGLVPRAVLVRRPRKIGRGGKAHGALVKLVAGIAPQHHPVVRQLLLFRVVCPVLQNYVGRRIDGPNGIRQTLQVGNSLGVVADVARVGHALGVVEPETVHLVFLQPVGVDAVHVVPNFRPIVVEIVAPAVRGMRTYSVEPRAVGGGGAGGGVPVHAHERALAKHVVEDLVQDYGNSAAVAGIDQFLKMLRRAVVLVQSHLVAGVVAPTFVALKFVGGHELDGVDAQALQVIQGVQNGFVAPGGDKVAHQKLVDDQLLLAGRRELGVFPHVSRFSGMNQGGVAGGFAGGVRMRIGVVQNGNAPVVGRVQNQLRIRIRNLQGAVDQVLKSVALAGLQCGQHLPPRFPVHGPTHRIGGVRSPVVEIAQHEHVVLQRRHQFQRYRAVVQIVDSVLQVRRGILRHHGRHPKHAQRVSRNSTARSRDRGHQNMVSGHRRVGVCERRGGAGGLRHHRAVVRQGPLRGLVGRQAQRNGRAGRNRWILRRRQKRAQQTGVGRVNGVVNIRSVAGTAHHGTRCVSEHKGQLLHGGSRRRCAVKRRNVVLNAVLVVAQRRHQNVGTGLPPSALNVLPVRGRGAGTGDDSGVRVDGRHAYQSRIALRGVVHNGHRVLSRGKRRGHL